MPSATNLAVPGSSGSDAAQSGRPIPNSTSMQPASFVRLSVVAPPDLRMKQLSGTEDPAPLVSIHIGRGVSGQGDHVQVSIWSGCAASPRAEGTNCTNLGLR